MQSQNFEFLRPTWEDLATLGAFAENYAHTDPSSATVKLRSFAEQIVLLIPNPWESSLDRDRPRLASHIEATWSNRDKDVTYLGLLRRGIIPIPL